MTLEEAVRIYRECPMIQFCDGCPISGKRYFGDSSICFLLAAAEKKAMEVK